METARKRNKKWIAVVLLILVAFGLGLAWRWVESTPQYALYRIGASLKNRDLEGFLVHVDLDRILQQQVAESVSTLLKSSMGDNPLGKLLGAVGEFRIVLDPGAQSGLSALVRKELGDYLRDPRNPTLPSSLLLLTIARFDTRDQVSLVTLEKGPDRLRMAMRRTGGVWRVIEFNPEDTQRLIKTYLLK